MINLTGTGNTSINYQGAIETDSSLAIEQANRLNPNAATINATTGTVVIP